MRRSIAIFFVLVLAGCGSAGGPPVATTPAPTPSSDLPDTALEWNDEFDGPAGALADPTKWRYEVGGNGFGNSELEYYTARAQNGSLSGDGMLVITARAEHYQGTDGVARDYTSARLNTSGLFETTHGTVSARIRIPRGQGMWPAFWLLGANISAVPWPGCGEIDIMENIGKQPSTVVGTIHGPGYSGGNGKNGTFTIPGNYADAFHVFAVQWERNSIRWLVDGNEYEHRTPADVPGLEWVFEHPFFVILNSAVGGTWPGSPDATTVFPQEMRVDYVRVSRKAS